MNVKKLFFFLILAGGSALGFFNCGNVDKVTCATSKGFKDIYHGVHHGMIKSRGGSIRCKMDLREVPSKCIPSYSKLTQLCKDVTGDSKAFFSSASCTND